MHFSYDNGLLRCVLALSLFASFIRDHKAAADTARARPAACLRTGSRLRLADTGDSQHLNYRNYLNSTLWGPVLRRPQARSDRTADGSAGTLHSMMVMAGAKPMDVQRRLGEAGAERADDLL